MAATPHRWDVTAILATLCGALAFALSVHAGRIGFMPLDQSIVFDGGWRMLSGQVPWRDFMSPNALVPMAMQAAFFGIGGVSWWSYVVHAGLINAAASALVFCYLSASGLNRLASLAAAVATGVWLYPLMGTPYMDNHSLFFSVVATASCWHAARTGQPRWWAGAGIAAALAILSKQVPALIVLPLAATAFFAAPFYRVAAGLAIAVVSSLATAAVLLAPIVLAGAQLTDLLESTWRLPATLGQDRFNDVLALFGPGAERLWRAMPFTHWCAVILSTATLGLVLKRGTRADHALPAGHGEWLMYLTGGIGLLFATRLASALTRNDHELLAGTMPFALALLLLAWTRVAAVALQGSPSWWIRPAVISVFCVATVADSVAGYNRVVLSRSGHDMSLTAGDRATVAPPVLQAVGFSVWRVPEKYTSAAASFGGLLTWFSTHPGNLFLLGDETILYGMTGRPSMAPVLWIHPGLTYRDDPASSLELDNRLDAVLKRYAVRWIVVPENLPWMTPGGAPYRALTARLGSRKCEHVGTYRVCDVGNEFAAAE